MGLGHMIVGMLSWHLPAHHQIASSYLHLLFQYTIIHLTPGISVHRASYALSQATLINVVPWEPGWYTIHKGNGEWSVLG